MNPRTRSLLKLGGKAFAVSTVVRQLSGARKEGDNLKLLDALLNAAALVTAVLIIVREIREHGDGLGEDLAAAGSDL